MNISLEEQVTWNVADLVLFPDDDKRYEIVNGELFVTRAPNWRHQIIADNICTELKLWSRKTGLGKAVTAPGVIFAETSSVIPDVVWVSNDRLPNILDDAGHLISAPELVVEVVSPGKEQQKRDRILKLKLYSQQGVQEYWIVDPDKTQVEIYRRENNLLKLVVTLFVIDNLTSPMLPGFSCQVQVLFE